MSLRRLTLHRADQEPGAQRPAPAVRRFGTALVSAVLVSALGATAASSAAAHGGGPAVEIVPTQAMPGDPVLLYGENLDPRAAVTVVLPVPDGERVLGRFVSDGEGHLVAEVVLPADLEPRAYEVRLTTNTGIAVTSLIIVVAGEAANLETAPLVVAAVTIGIGATLLAGVLVTRRRPGIGGR